MGMGGPGGMHVFMWGPGGRGEGKRPTLSMYRRLLQYVGPYKWNLVFAAVLLVVSTVLGLVWPQVVQRVIDLGLNDEGFLDILILGLIVVLLVRAVLDGGRQFVMAYTGERVIFDLRMSIVRHMQSLSLSFFNRRKTGELMSHVTSDATLVHGVVTQTIIQVLGQVLTLIGGVAVIFLMNWRLAAIFCKAAFKNSKKNPHWMRGYLLFRQTAGSLHASAAAGSAGSRLGGLGLGTVPGIEPAITFQAECC